MLNNEVTALLHIGAGKCGSSAIQSALSISPRLKNEDGDSIEYICITPSGSIVSDWEMTECANTTVYGYHSCPPASFLASLPEHALSRIEKQLTEKTKNGGKIILSSEGWINEANTFKEYKLLKKLNINCNAVAYIRPPADWLNSAWWQWGAWSGVPFEYWIESNIPLACWYDLTSPWLELDNVKKLQISTLPEDVVKDFFKTIKCSPTIETRTNTSLPPEILYLFQTAKILRPHPHASHIDFVVSRNIKNLNKKTPWVIGKDTLNKIIKRTRKSNLKLLSLLTDEEAQKIINDPRWWDPDGYETKVETPPENNKPSYEDLLSIAVESINALSRLESEKQELLARFHERTEQ